MLAGMSSQQIAAFLVGIVASFGCASKPPGASNPEAPATAEGAAPGPERECLERANGEHTKRPDEPTRIGLRHILVRHAESKRADGTVTRTRGQACLRALEALNALEAGTEWDQAVAKYSDEQGAATRRGSLGSLTRDDLDPAFADAAFELEPDQVSYVVESPAGFHVILRVE
jgi:hypothetical protein